MIRDAKKVFGCRKHDFQLVFILLYIILIIFFFFVICRSLTAAVFCPFFPQNTYCLSEKKENNFGTVVAVVLGVKKI